VPPPSHVSILSHYASAFFFAVFFALGAASADAVAGFLEVALFNLALIEFLLLDTPKEPIVRFPFFVFLSPRPMFKNNLWTILANQPFIAKYEWNFILKQFHSLTVIDYID
jgi:hypothetical protein